MHARVPTINGGRGGYVAGGGRQLSVLSRRRDLQKPDLIEVLFLRGEAQIVLVVGEDLELAHYRAAGGGQALPRRALPGFRLSS